MSKHRAPRYTRTKKVLAGVPVVAGATVVGLGVLSTPAHAHTAGTTDAAVEAPATPLSHYTVTRGDTLGEIAAAHGQPWRELYERNTGVIGGNPGAILPGQVLAIGESAQPRAPRAVAPVAAPVRAPVQQTAAAQQIATARVTNSAGPVRPRAQAAANAVVADVPGAASITIGGTRTRAADPGGHPAGLALDFMVMADTGLGDAIVAYHIARWDELGVEYIIWQQRILTSPTGSWSPMGDRGSATANHMDHPHVNYRAG